MDYFSCHDMITKIKYILSWLGPQVNIYWSSNLNNKSHKLNRAIGRKTQSLMKHFKKFLLVLIFGSFITLYFPQFQNLGCYRSSSLKINLVLEICQRSNREVQRHGAEDFLHRPKCCTKLSSRILRHHDVARAWQAVFSGEICSF